MADKKKPRKGKAGRTYKAPNKVPGKTTLAAEKVAAEMRRRDIVTMRVAGSSFRQIAAAMSMAPSSVYQSLRVALDRTITETDETAEELRELERQRLDYYTRQLDKRIRGETVRDKDGNILSYLPGADVQAIESGRRLSESRRRLDGLDAPAELKVDIRDVQAKLRAKGEELAEALKDHPEARELVAEVFGADADS